MRGPRLLYGSVLVTSVLVAIVILALSGQANAATVAVALVSVLGILAERLLTKSDKDDD